MKKNKKILEEIARIRLLMEGRGEVITWVTQQLSRINPDDVKSMLKSTGDEVSNARRISDDLAAASGDEIILLFKNLDPVKLGRQLFMDGTLITRGGIDQSINRAITTIEGRSNIDEQVATYEEYIKGFNNFQLENIVPPSTLDEDWFKNIMDEAFEEWKIRFIQTFQSRLKQEAPDIFSQINEKIVAKSAQKLLAFDRIWYRFFNEDAGTIRRVFAKSLKSQATLMDEYVKFMQTASILISKGQNADAYIKKATDSLIASNKLFGSNMKELTAMFMRNLNAEERRIFRENDWGEQQIIKILSEKKEEYKILELLVGSLKRGVLRLLPPISKLKNVGSDSWGLWIRSWVQYIIKLNPITAKDFKKQLVTQGYGTTVAQYIANFLISKLIILPVMVAATSSVVIMAKAAMDPNTNLYDMGYESLGDLLETELYKYKSEQESLKGFEKLWNLTAIDEVGDLIKEILTFKAPNVPIPDDLAGIMKNCAKEVRQYYADAQIIPSLVLAGRPCVTFYWGNIPTGWPENENYTIFKNSRNEWTYCDSNGKYHLLSAVVELNPDCN